jgi:hypothetical protein
MNIWVATFPSPKFKPFKFLTLALEDRNFACTNRRGEGGDGSAAKRRNSVPTLSIVTEPMHRVSVTQIR